MMRAFNLFARQAGKSEFLRQQERLLDDIAQRGLFGMRCFAPARKSGTREKLWETTFHNAATYEGLNLAQNLLFKNGSPLPNWYFGLINASPSPTLSASDTMASHTGWTEFTSYDEATRQAWVPGTPASGALTTGTAATVTISATGTIRGAFLTSVSTKSGATGTLWATALEGANRNVVDDQSLQIYYTNTFTPVS